ncbi:TPA: morphogenetic protein [Enterobacter hormaechei]|nr:morphogenetic protein [Enterobacter hormaechei]HED3211800.1 morphogenetic protein [Enterobacter hormaechei subsp. xiangfangensis]HED3281998.1 morphogenetic protein [Enterobacter hormaechei subsp. xiangfangensis]HED4105647.1 morphogenetic protein [Enterobacter hormaechei subsp. xiangfangensis]HED4131206.1 morphogenetic protein [Enterobacter hormaechei subsp. xiangfangensis]
MTERGMIFNSEMVRAILDGRKIQTRRIIKDCTVGRDPISKFIQIGKKFIGCYPEDVPELIRECCPYGVPGDRIWVRETFQGPLFDFEQMEAYQEDSSKFKKPEFCVYKADGKRAPEFLDADDNLHCGWRPSIHMPRWASRITLEITGVRVEQLNDISEEDARSEGISGSSVRDVKEAYAALWRSIYGSDSWRANPWVWVIKFKRIEGDGHATD